MAKPVPQNRSLSTSHSPSRGGRLSRYSAAASRFLGAAKAKGSSAVTTARTKAAFAGAALARTAATDTLGGLFAQNVVSARGVSAVGFGAIDATAWGQKLYERTGGWLHPSTAAFALGVAARGFNLDRKYLGKNVTHGNTQMLQALFPIKLYQLGGRIPGAISKQMGGGSAPSKVAGVAGADVKVVDVEPVPGEATRA